VVSSSSVDFELTDVDKVSEALLPLHNVQVNKLVKTLKIKTLITSLAKLFPDNTDFKWHGVNLGTIHKHPGHLNSFSGTDLSTSTKSPGICFPFGPLTNEDLLIKPSFSSILLHEKSRTVVSHTEYRQAFMHKKTTLVYSKSLCLTSIYQKVSQPNQLQAFLGITPEKDSYSLENNIPTSATSIINTIHETVITALRDIDYNASTKYILADNVSKRVITPQPTTSYYGSSYYRQGNSINSSVIPHRNSKEWKTIAENVGFEYDLELYSLIELNSLSEVERIKYYKELYKALNPLKPINTISEIPSITIIVELQNKLWQQVKDTYSVSTPTKNTFQSNNYHLESLLDKYTIFDEEDENEINLEQIRSDLISWGIDKHLISHTDNELLVKWWTAIEDEAGRI